MILFVVKMLVQFGYQVMCVDMSVCGRLGQPVRRQNRWGHWLAEMVDQTRLTVGYNLAESAKLLDNTVCMANSAIYI